MAAIALKDAGNKAFQAGDFREAESLYGRAITKDPKNPAFFTNRAFARIKLESWDPCMDDCFKAIELNERNMKAWYYLAQAQLQLKHPNEALTSALMAYEICMETPSSSIHNVVQLVLRAKKTKWEVKERQRLRERSEMLRELEDALRESGARELEDITNEDDAEEIRKSTKRKIEELESIFAIADPANLERKEVPDYMIDNITFQFMHDPVITKSGQSYERSTIEAHLKISPTDPLTREPLRKEDLRPNLALKQACEEFLEKNGWAADW